MLKIGHIGIIGAGPAGLAAAVEAAKAGAKVTLLDKNQKPGGQLFKQLHKFFGSEEHGAGIRGFQIGNQLLEDAKYLGVEVLLGTDVWGIFDNKELGITLKNDHQDRKAKKIKFDRIIIATGASENVALFDGWTLPGVIGAGGLQTFMNEYRVLPGKRVLMVGSGNIGLIVAYQLLQAGAEVKAIVEIQEQIGGYEVHATKLMRQGIPILKKHLVVSVEGNNKVEKAIIAEIDNGGNIKQESKISLDVDIVCLSVGLNPLTELVHMAGCEIKYLPELGGFVPVHDEKLETTIKGIYVAGDLAGIEEASTALDEGRLAGISAAESLNLISNYAANLKRDRLWASLNALRSGKHDVKRKYGKEQLLSYTGKKLNTNLKEASNVSVQNKLDKSKPMPIIDCFQDIPCDPCEKACPRGLIKVGYPITNLPVVDNNKCNGCGKCVAECPGLCIVIIDMSYSDTEAKVIIAHEYLPLPLKGDQVELVDANGDFASKGRVVEVEKKPIYNLTPLIHVSVAKSAAEKVRGIKALGLENIQTGI